MEQNVIFHDRVALSNEVTYAQANDYAKIVFTKRYVYCHRIVGVIFAIYAFTLIPASRQQANLNLSAAVLLGLFALVGAVVFFTATIIEKKKFVRQIVRSLKENATMKEQVVRFYADFFIGGLKERKFMYSQITAVLEGDLYNYIVMDAGFIPVNKTHELDATLKQVGAPQVSEVRRMANPGAKMTLILWPGWKGRMILVMRFAFLAILLAVQLWILLSH